jgi:hypothetical protein
LRWRMAVGRNSSIRPLDSFFKLSFGIRLILN